MHYTGLQGFVVEKLWVVSGVIFDAESESGIRISLSRQDFEIFEVMCLKNGVFRYFWGYVQGARNFFGFFLKCHHLALLFPFKMSYWTVTSDFFSQRYGPIKFWHLSEQPYEHSHWLFGAYHFAFENSSWKCRISDANTVFSVDFDPRHWIYYLGNGNVNFATSFS